MQRAWIWGHASMAALALTACLAAPAEGQESEPADVGGVVITAEKRAEDPQTAPIAATVFNEDTLRRGSVDDVDDLEFVTPSLTIATAGQANMMNMRGIGKFDAGGTSTSAIATYRDGVGTVSGFFNHEPYYDIESVEVLRGPQGTYVGENAAGGAIFVNTRDPEIGAGLTGYGRAGLGNYRTRELEGAVNIPITDTMALRISGRHVARDSFYDVFTDPAGTVPHPEEPGQSEHNSLRLGLLWEPTEPLSILFKLDLHRLDHGGNVFGTVPGLQAPSISNDSDLYSTGMNYLSPYYRDKMARGILELNYDFADGSSFRWITGAQYINTHIRNDDDGTASADVMISIRPIFRVYTTEATFISPEEQRLRWLVGAFARREMLWFPDNDGFEVHAPSNVPLTSVPFLKINWRTPRDTQAVYGQLAYDITDNLEIVGGLRLQHYEMEQRAQTTLFGGPFPGTTTGIREDGYEEDTVNYKIALNYQMTPEHYFYGFIATGNTTGGNSVLLAASGPNLGFENQTSTTYEAGWKGTLMDGRLLTQFGGFYTVIQDYQASFAEVIDVGPPVVTRSTFQNLEDDTTAYGLELQLQAKIENFGVDFNAAWIHSELGEALIFDATPPGTIINTGGNRIPWTPEYTFNIGLEYDFHLWNGATLTPRITYSWVDEQTVTAIDRVLAGIPVDRIFAHEIANAQLTLETDNWLVQAYVTNLFEEEYIQAHSGDTIPDPDAYANEPRRYGIRATRRF